MNGKKNHFLLLLGLLFLAGFASAQTPSISYRSPSDDANLSSSTINFSATITIISFAPSNASLYNNVSGAWAINQTNSSGLPTNPMSSVGISFITTENPSNTGFVWNIQVCSSGGCSFVSSNRTAIVDLTAPTFSALNSPVEGATIGANYTFNMTLRDNIQLANASVFHNNTGSWHRNATNSSLTAIDNATQILVEVYDLSVTSGTIWAMQACDVAGNCALYGTNTTLAQNSSASDTASPQYLHNQTNSTIAGQAIKFSLYWTDSTALSNYTFSFDNGTGGFTNDSAASFSGTTNTSNVTKFVNTTIGSTIRWRVWANDSSSNMNASPIYSLNTTSATTTNTAPYSAATPEIDPEPADNSTALNCTATFADTTNSQLTYVFSWYKNNAQNTSLDSNRSGISNNTAATTNTSVPVALLSVGSTWVCSARAADGTYYSDWVNSTAVEILASVNNLVTRTTISCPSTLTNQAGTITVAYYNKNKLSCTGIALTAQNSTGSNLTKVIGTQKCVSNKATYPINFTTSGTYTILAIAGGSTSRCTIEYKGVSLLPNRVPDLNPLLLPLVAFAAIAIARRARK